jgi:patatin-like phospholipase/acyl hydrolase
MTTQFPLQGVRIHLSGSIPQNAATSDAEGIASFTEEFAAAVLRDGGALLHGSHPTLMQPLEKAARAYVTAGGAKDALTLVRSQSFAATDEQRAEIEAQRQFCNVELVPSPDGQPLLPMREWMAERCDVVVTIGGRHYDVIKEKAGVPDELEEALGRGKPGFVVTAFGGAIAGYVKDHDEIFSRLRNGLRSDENRELAANANVPAVVERIIKQIQLLPVVRQSTTRRRLFRILALDGGGLRGAFTAAVLAQWDEMLKPGGGNEIVKHFDLVAGTSTGSILAIGLGLGFTPKDMLQFYRTQGPKIFSKDRWFRHWLKSKHESATLRATLEAALGTKLLKDSCCRLVIPTVRADHGQAEAIVTPHSPDRTGFAAIAAVDAALASSAAPTYFDEAQVTGPLVRESFLDGGVWANNPVLAALAEAVGFLNVQLERIDVLSVGTLGNEADFSEQLGKGKIGWASDSADLFFAAQETGAATLASRLLSRARHLRVNQQTPGEIKLDDKGAIEDMAKRGAIVGRDSFDTVRFRFLDGFHVADWRN